jgi:hypothetical protein
MVEPSAMFHFSPAIFTGTTLLGITIPAFRFMRSVILGHVAYCAFALTDAPLIL